jgi:hypothetical protein
LTRQKIILDETVNPKRPLRPNRLNTQNSTSSPSNSNQSSRPVSHLSGDELSSTNSIQQLNGNVISFKIADIMMQEEETKLEESINKTPMPPPKPPKPSNIIFNLKENNSYNDILQSNKTLCISKSAHTTPKKNQNNGKFNLDNSMSNQNKSTISLNNKGVQFRNLNIKTNSDSILNRVYIFTLISFEIPYHLKIKLYFYRRKMNQQTFEKKFINKLS